MSEQIEAAQSELESGLAGLKDVVDTKLDVAGVQGEITKALSEEGSVQAAINSAVSHAATTLNNEISTKVSALQVADNALGEKITSETAAREALAQTVADNKTELEDKIAEATETAQSYTNDALKAYTTTADMTRAIDTAKEAAIASAKTYTDTGLATERDERIAADAALTSALAQETTNRESAVAAVETKLAQEAASRQATDDLLTKQIADANKAVELEAAQRKAADRVVAQAVQKETDDRVEADLALQGLIGQTATDLNKAIENSAKDTLAQAKGYTDNYLSEYTQSETFNTTIENLFKNSGVVEQRFDAVKQAVEDSFSGRFQALSDRDTALEAAIGQNASALTALSDTVDTKTTLDEVKSHIASDVAANGVIGGTIQTAADAAQTAAEATAKGYTDQQVNVINDALTQEKADREAKDTALLAKIDMKLDQEGVEGVIADELAQTGAIGSAITTAVDQAATDVLATAQGTFASKQALADEANARAAAITQLENTKADKSAVELLDSSLESTQSTLDAVRTTLTEQGQTLATVQTTTEQHTQDIAALNQTLQQKLESTDVTQMINNALADSGAINSAITSQLDGLRQDVANHYVSQTAFNAQIQQNVAALDDMLAKAKAYTNTEVEGAKKYTEDTVTEAYNSLTTQMNTLLSAKADKTQVARDIAAAVEPIDSRVDTLESTVTTKLDIGTFNQFLSTFNQQLSGWNTALQTTVAKQVETQVSTVTPRLRRMARSLVIEEAASLTASDIPATSTSTSTDTGTSTSTPTIDFSGLTAQMSDTQTQLESLATRTTSVESRTTNLEALTRSLQAEDQRLEDVKADKTELAALQGRVNEITSGQIFSTQDFNQAFSQAFSTSFATEWNNKIADFNTQLDSKLATKLDVSTFNDFTQNLETRLGTFASKERVEEVARQVGTNTTDIATLKTQISNVSTAVDTNRDLLNAKADKAALDALADRVGVNEQDIQQLRTDFDTHEAQFLSFRDTVSSKLSIPNDATSNPRPTRPADGTNTGSDTGSTDTGSGSTGSGSGSAQNYVLASEYEQTKSQVATNTQDISAVKETIKDYDQVREYATAAAVVAHDNSQRIDKMNARIDRFEQSVDHRFKDMQKGLAHQAALSGLFQPYSVGKFNVSAAVGGYKGEQAIAVGSGYRINEHVAVKMGVATDVRDPGSASYNVGVNIEW